MRSLKFNYDKDLPKASNFKQEYLINQVTLLKEIPQHIQKSQGWYEMRNTLISASDWGTILGMNHYSNSNSVLLKKCGEDNFIKNAAMDWGNKYEDVAISIYEYRNQVKVSDFGCIRHPNISFLGASPDGITDDGIMLEIKCVVSREITGIPPEHYWCQVQGQLEICELDRCDFLECKFLEYNNETEYLEDNYEENIYLNKYGYEKGVIAEFYRKDDKTLFFNYSPVNIIGDNLNKWKKSIVEKNINENIIFSCFYYWYLLEVSCVPIYRNQEWFNNTALPNLEIFWNKVLKYRELGLNILKRDLENEKLEKNRIKDEKKKKDKEDKTISKKQKKIKDFIDLGESAPAIITNPPSDDDSSIDDDFNLNSTNISFFSDS